MHLKQLWKYRFLLRELVIRDIKKKYRRSVLGILWSILNPLLMMAITAMVFSTLFRFEIKNYPVYLLTGQILFTFFAESTNFAMGSIIDNSSLIKKVYIPKFMFPLSRVVSSLVNFMLTLPAVIIIIIFTSHRISLVMISCIIPIFLLFLFCLGIGLFLSACTVYFRDVFHLYGVVLTMFSYATPIFYPVSIIPDKFLLLMKLNPLSYFLAAFRYPIYDNLFPSMISLAYCAFLSFVVLIIGGYFFYKKQNKFILYI